MNETRVLGNQHAENFTVETTAQAFMDGYELFIAATVTPKEGLPAPKLQSRRVWLDYKEAIKLRDFLNEIYG